MPLPSRAISHARGHLRVSRFARQTTETRETARSLDQYGMSALVPQTSFGGETSGSVAKGWLFSQATQKSF